VLVTCSNASNRDVRVIVCLGAKKKSFGKISSKIHCNESCNESCNHCMNAMIATQVQARKIEQQTCTNPASARRTASWRILRKLWLSLKLKSGIGTLAHSELDILKASEIELRYSHCQFDV
jgi:hypothetical protein